MCDKEVKVKFIGRNAEHVAGSTILVEYDGVKILLDHGLEQGRGNIKDFKNNSMENNQIAPSKIDYILNTHVHLDHTGLIPQLYKQGFQGKIVHVKGVHNIMQELWKDSSYLSYKTAEYLNRIEKTKKYEAYYGNTELQKCKQNKIEIPMNYEYQLEDGIKIEFISAGHIYKSAQVRLILKHGSHNKTLCFTGDLGSDNINYQYTQKRAKIPNSDVVIAESTYGGKYKNINHESDKNNMIKHIDMTIKANGKVLLPSFALHRAEELLKILYDEYKDKHINFNIYLDSPLANKILSEYKKNFKSIKDITKCNRFKIVRSAEQSKALCRSNESCVIVSSSGMLIRGTRSYHHAMSMLEGNKNTIIKVGYASEGTGAYDIFDDKGVIELGDKIYYKKCQLIEYDSFSSHIQRDEMIHEYSNIYAPQGVYLVHGDKSSRHSLKQDLNDISSNKGNSTTFHTVKRDDIIKF